MTDDVVRLADQLRRCEVARATWLGGVVPLEAVLKGDAIAVVLNHLVVYPPGLRADIAVMGDLIPPDIEVRAFAVANDGERPLFVQAERGVGAEGYWAATYWVLPLPDDGERLRLSFVGVGERDIDGALIQDAARRSRQLREPPAQNAPKVARASAGRRQA